MCPIYLLICSPRRAAAAALAQQLRQEQEEGGILSPRAITSPPAALPGQLAVVPDTAPRPALMRAPSSRQLAFGGAAAAAGAVGERATCSVCSARSACSHASFAAARGSWASFNLNM